MTPNRAVNNQSDGNLYDKSAFAYDAKSESFTCPTGKQLSRKDKILVYAARR